MSFQPVIPFGGFAGYAFLKRTMAIQQAALQTTAVNQRDEAYFKEKIGTINSAEELVSDRRLLLVALTAYGLEGDINSKAFIQKVLEGGTLSGDSLANRLSNKQYEQFSAAFGFGDFKIPRSKISDFADKTLALYRTRQFETAVGTQNNDFRLALNAERELGVLAARNTTENTKWFSVMGSAPLRQAFQTALGLPSSFSSIDLDQQLSVMKSRAESVFGDDSISQFSDPQKLNKLVQTYLVRSEIAALSSPTSSSSIALEILQMNRS